MGGKGGSRSQALQLEVFQAVAYPVGHGACLFSFTQSKPFRLEHAI